MKWFDTFKACFSGGISISIRNYDESARPLASWICNYVKDQRSFRRDLVNDLLHANARSIVLETYYSDPFRGRLDDMRQFAVPFQLLPFALPEPCECRISDTARQAVIHKYGDRFGLINPGDIPSEVRLSLPEGAAAAFDLSNGIRQRLLVNEGAVTLHMAPWSLKTLEIR